MQIPYDADEVQELLFGKTDTVEPYNESSLNRLLEKIETGSVGIISALRNENSKEENLKNHQELKEGLRKRGFGTTILKGHFVEDFDPSDQTKGKDVVEVSIFVAGDKENQKLKNALIELGKKYKQDSILYKPFNDENAYLIGTRDGAYPGLGKEQKLGKWIPKKTGEFYSHLKGKKNSTFVFESFGFGGNITTAMTNKMKENNN